MVLPLSYPIMYKKGWHRGNATRDNVRWHRSGGASGVYKLSADDVVTTMRLLKSEKSEIPNRKILCDFRCKKSS